MSGTFFTGGAYADAEYFFGGVLPPTPVDFEPPNRGSVDYGVAIDDVSQAPRHRKTPYWGRHNLAHVYAVWFVGRGAPIAVNVHDSIPGDNVLLQHVPGTGPLTLRIYGPPKG